jgi:anthranilate synthase component 1
VTTPTYDAFAAQVRAGAIIPVYRELLADMETPLAIYARVCRRAPAFLLESVEGGEHVARYSFIGVQPLLEFIAHGTQITIRAADGTTTTSVADSPIAELRRRLSVYHAVHLPGLPRFCGGAVGYIGYGAVRFFEDIPQTNPNDLALPDLHFMFTKAVIAFDHVRHRILVIANAHCDGRPARAVYDEAGATIAQVIEQLAHPLPVTPVAPLSPAGLQDLSDRQPPSNMAPERYMQIVERCKEYVRAGDIIQVVPSQRFAFPTTASALDLYRALRCVNPSPYMFLLQFDGYALAGSSPELMVRVQDGTAELRPIAGTRRRGLTPEEDLALEHELLADPKERAEHIMLVDLGRNDLGRVCTFGSVHVAELMVVERYSHVMHIVSNVSGTVNPGQDAFDVLAATFPAGTVTGAPKIRAMQIIDEMESCGRGPYAGTVCYFGYDGALDSCITIRTMVVKDQTVYVQAGAGIVADSVPALEYQETVNKARGMMKAITLAEQLQSRI